MNHIKNFIAIAVFSAFSVQAFSQARETAPAPTVGPMDYGKDASTQKLHKHIISFGFFSLLNQHISFGYDQLLGNDMVLTTQLGIIGPSATTNGNSYSYSNSPNPAGAFVEGGLKLFFAPDFVTVGTMRYNSMQGYYFKPQIVISSFEITQYGNNNYNYYNNPPTPPTATRVNYTGVAFMLSLGKQWILAHSVSLDVYAGIGYAISGASGNNDAPLNYYSFESTSAGAGGAGVAISGGVNIGVPF